jgi:hypothetical protein
VSNVSEVTRRVVNVVHKMAGAAAGWDHLGGSILAATTGAARAEPALNHHVHQVAFVSVLLGIAATVHRRSTVGTVCYEKKGKQYIQ